MRITVSCLLCILTIVSFGQSPYTSGFFNYHLTDRYEIQSNELTTEFYTGIKPYRRDAVARFAKKLTAQNVKKQTLLKPGYVAGELIGSVLFIDNIGNVYTNISRQDFTSFFEGKPFIIKLSRHHILDKISDELINFKPSNRNNGGTRETNLFIARF